MFESESFPAPLDSSAVYPSKYPRGRSMFSGCFPMPTRHSHSNSNYYSQSSHRQHSGRARNFNEEMLERGGGRKFGGGGRSYFNHHSSSGSGLLPPSFITREEEECGKTTTRAEDCTFPDINDMTFPSPVEYRHRQGGPMPWHSAYTPVSNVGGSGSHRMFSSCYSPFSKRNRSKQHGSFISLASYDVPPDFEAPTSRGRPLEKRRGSLSKDYHDESYYNGYMSL